MRAIVDALKHAEGAGANCELAGASGETGCWQFMDATWDLFVYEVYGEWKPLDSYARERYVVTQMVQKWVDQGMNAAQIALRWNAGGATKCSSGINRQGVPYDSCKHVNKVLAYLHR